MADWCTCYIFGERPEAVKLYILTQFQSSTGDHKARRQPIGFNSLSPPELGKISEVSGIEKDGFLSCTELLQSVMHFERSSSIAPEGKSWQQKESISVARNIFQEGGLLFIQFVISVNMQN